MKPVKPSPPDLVEATKGTPHEVIVIELDPITASDLENLCMELIERFYGDKPVTHHGYLQRVNAALKNGRRNLKPMP
jgi:hypothetical protein